MTEIPAVVVNQWLPEWNETSFQPVPPRAKPEPYFYVFSISAYDLRRLSGIYRRGDGRTPAEDRGIQRRHIPSRSKEILRYLQDGFPLSRIPRQKLVDQSEVNSLRMPGWLPTAIVANILMPTDQRGPNDTQVRPQDLVAIHRPVGSNSASITLPEGFDGDDWQPKVHPIEIIDGQHRLWALEEPDENSAPWSDEFREKIRTLEIPVVAYHGLDRTWQAYLFYTINQLPQPINQSLVFDLYPLLRTEDWLLRFEGPNIYRETRAQDITVLLWSHPDSPWKDRILRLGGREKGKVTQASFIRSLLNSFIKQWIIIPEVEHGVKITKIGGMFGSRPRKHQSNLGWGREQQAAFLIMAWQELKYAVTRSDADWALALVQRCRQSFGSVVKDRIDDLFEASRGEENVFEDIESQCRMGLFSGPETLLATDQGVRAYLQTLNDILWVAENRQQINLDAWLWLRGPEFDNDQPDNLADDTRAVSDALEHLRSELPDAVSLVADLAQSAATFDWRVSSAVAEFSIQHAVQASYRGSGGYRQLRRNLLMHLKEQAGLSVSACAVEVMEALKFETDEEA